MAKRNSSPTIGDIYGEMLKQVSTVEESTIKKGGNELNDGVPLADGGPSKKGGWDKALEDLYANPEEDEEEVTDEEMEDEDEDCDVCEEDEEELLESTKKSKQQVNKHMKKNKSIFDQYCDQILSENWGGFEDAEDDIDALGLGDATPDSDLGDDFGGEEDGDSVTFTLDRATAQALVDVLQGALGDDMGGDDFGDEDGLDFGDDDLDGEVGEEDEMDFEEDEEGYMPTDKVGNDGTEKDIVKSGSHPLQQKNNKVKGKPQPKGGKAGTTNNVMDKVGNDGTKDGQPDIGKQNKVSNLKQGEDFFR